MWINMKEKYFCAILQSKHLFIFQVHAVHLSVAAEEVHNFWFISPVESEREYKAASLLINFLLYLFTISRLLTTRSIWIKWNIALFFENLDTNCMVHLQRYTSYIITVKICTEQCCTKHWANSQILSVYSKCSCKLLYLVQVNICLTITGLSIKGLALPGITPKDQLLPEVSELF